MVNFPNDSFLSVTPQVTLCSPFKLSYYLSKTELLTRTLTGTSFLPQEPTQVSKLARPGGPPLPSLPPSLFTWNASVPQFMTFSFRSCYFCYLLWSSSKFPSHHLVSSTILKRAAQVSPFQKLPPSNRFLPHLFAINFTCVSFRDFCIASCLWLIFASVCMCVCMRMHMHAYTHTYMQLWKVVKEEKSKRVKEESTEVGEMKSHFRRGKIPVRHMLQAHFSVRFFYWCWLLHVAFPHTKKRWLGHQEDSSLGNSLPSPEGSYRPWFIYTCTRSTVPGPEQGTQQLLVKWMMQWTRAFLFMCDFSTSRTLILKS